MAAGAATAAAQSCIAIAAGQWGGGQSRRHSSATLPGQKGRATYRAPSHGAPPPGMRIPRQGVGRSPAAAPAATDADVAGDVARRTAGGAVSRPLRPVEERYRFYVERGISEERRRELGVDRWSHWESGCCGFPHSWPVDEEIFIERGVIRIRPLGAADFAELAGGDFARIPRWLDADVSVEAPLRLRYRFRAYGDD